MPDRRRRVIDFHTHVFPEKAAARVVEALTSHYGVAPLFEPTIPRLLELMDAAGIDKAVTAPVAPRPDQVRAINDWARASCSERLICFGALHPDMDDPVAEVERIIDLGLKGIKLQPHFQHFSPDEARLRPIYEAAAGRLIVLFHSGQEIAPVTNLLAHPAVYARVHAQFPRLTMVVAHLGGYLMWKEVREHLVGKEVYLETSYCREEDISDLEMRELILAHGTEHVLFGSDFPWRNPKHDLERFLRLGLPPNKEEAITWRNTYKLLGIES